jgi:hypothetical protein
VNGDLQSPNGKAGFGFTGNNPTISIAVSLKSQQRFPQGFAREHLIW